MACGISSWSIVLWTIFWEAREGNEALEQNLKWILLFLPECKLLLIHFWERSQVIYFGKIIISWHKAVSTATTANTGYFQWWYSIKSAWMLHLWIPNHCFLQKLRVGPWKTLAMIFCQPCMINTLCYMNFFLKTSYISFMCWHWTCVQ